MGSVGIPYMIRTRQRELYGCRSNRGQCSAHLAGV